MLSLNAHGSLPEGFASTARSTPLLEGFSSRFCLWKMAEAAAGWYGPHYGRAVESSEPGGCEKQALSPRLTFGTIVPAALRDGRSCSAPKKKLNVTLSRPNRLSANVTRFYTVTCGLCPSCRTD